MTTATRPQGGDNDQHADTRCRPAAAIAARAKARTDAERRPGRIGASIDTFGRTTRLGASALRYAVTDIVSLRFPLREMLSQAWFIITVTAIPGILMAIPFGVIVSTQVGNLVHQLGASSMIGAAGGMGVIKQGAPVATGLLLGGAGAAAIAADPAPAPPARRSTRCG